MTETYVLHVTKECNMNCLYCYEDDKSSVYTWEEIKEYLEQILETAPPSFRLEFLGGEPMLAFNFIKKTVDYLSNVPYQIEYTITTNGTILEDHHIKWLQEHPNVTFAISVDGPGFANMFRITKDNKSSWSICLNNMKRMLENNLEPHVHVVSHPYNVAYLYESIKIMYKEGIRHIGVGTVEKTIKIDEEYCSEFVYQLKLVSDAIKNGELKDLYIDVLNGLKPKEDVRTYIRDASGKVVGESYGRVENDFTRKNNDEYNIQRCETTTEVGNMIFNIRKAVYEYHNIRLFK